MKNILLVVAAMVLILGAGLVDGAWTNRWRSSRALADQAAGLEKVPMVIGEWKASPLDMPAGDLAMTGAVGHLSRRYTSESRGITLTVLLLCGLPGRISTHTPDVCFPGAGFTLDSPADFSRQYGSPEREAQFRTAVATRGTTSPSVQRIFWGWNDSKAWSAPEDPRWKFASAPALCKLYVVRETAGAVVDPKDDPCNDFLALFLPEVDRCVFPRVQ
jgi:hypothetical protein